MRRKRFRGLEVQGKGSGFGSSTRRHREKIVEGERAPGCSLAPESQGDVRVSPERRIWLQGSLKSSVLGVGV